MGRWYIPAKSMIWKLILYLTLQRVMLTKALYFKGRGGNQSKSFSRRSYFSVSDLGRMISHKIGDL